MTDDEIKSEIENTYVHSAFISFFITMLIIAGLCFFSIIPTRHRVDELEKKVEQLQKVER